jgi:hypothetical protein
MIFDNDRKIKNLIDEKQMRITNELNQFCDKEQSHIIKSRIHYSFIGKQDKNFIH